MGTSNSGVAQLIDPAGAYRSVAPVHHGRDGDFSVGIQNVRSIQKVIYKVISAVLL
jgi:hypothetical protein